MRATTVVILAALALASLGGLLWRGGPGSVAVARFEGPLKTLFLAGHGPVTVPLGTVARGAGEDGRLRLAHLTAAHADLLVRPVPGTGGPRVAATADDPATAAAARALEAALRASPQAEEPILAPEADPQAALDGAWGAARSFGPALPAVETALREAVRPARLIGWEGAWVDVSSDGPGPVAPVTGGCTYLRAAGDPLPERWAVRPRGGPAAGPVEWIARGRSRAYGRMAEGHLLLDLRRAGPLDLLCATTGRDPLALALHAAALATARLPAVDDLPDEALATLRAHRSAEPLGAGLFAVIRDGRRGVFVMRPDGRFVAEEGWLSVGWLPGAQAIVVERRSGPGRTSPNDRGLLHPDGTMLVEPDYYDLGDAPGRPGLVRLWRGGKTALYSVPDRRLLPPDG